MKKTLAILLATLLLFTGLVVGTSAAETVTKGPLNFYPIDTYLGPNSIEAVFGTSVFDSVRNDKQIQIYTCEEPKLYTYSDMDLFMSDIDNGIMTYVTSISSSYASIKKDSRVFNGIVYDSLYVDLSSCDLDDDKYYYFLLEEGTIYSSNGLYENSADVFTDAGAKYYNDEYATDYFTMIFEVLFAPIIEFFKSILAFFGITL